MTRTVAEEFYGAHSPADTLKRWVDRKRGEYTLAELLEFVLTVEEMLRDGVPDTGIACVLAEAVVERKRPKPEPRPAPEKYRKCRTCGERKSESSYYRDRSSLKLDCKKCFLVKRNGVQ